MNFTLEEINQAVGGTLEGAGNQKVTGYSIDSRTLHAGDLFFAVKGPRFDGHAFIEQVFQKKAAGAVVEEHGPKPPAGYSGPVIRVASTVDALQTLARTARRR